MPFTTQKMEKVRQKRRGQWVYFTRPTPIPDSEYISRIQCDMLYHPLTQRRTTLPEIEAFVASVESGAYVPPANRSVNLFDPCTKQLITYDSLKKRIDEIRCYPSLKQLRNLNVQYTSIYDVLTIFLRKSFDMRCILYSHDMKVFVELFCKLFTLFGGIKEISVKSGEFEIQRVEEETDHSSEYHIYSSIKDYLTNESIYEIDTTIVSNIRFMRKRQTAREVTDPYCEVACNLDNLATEYKSIIITNPNLNTLKSTILNIFGTSQGGLTERYLLFVRSQKALEADAELADFCREVFGRYMYGVEEDVIPYLEEIRAKLLEYAAIKRITGEQAFDEIYFQNKAPLLQLQLHQDIIVTGINDAIQRQDVLPEGKERDNRFLIGVLPRGGKTFIAGGIIREYIIRHNVQRANVLWITAAPNETKKQVEKQLVGNFQDFDGFDFIEAKTTTQVSGRTKPHAVYFVSSQLLTLGRTSSAKQREYLTKLLGASAEDSLTMVFFDEAHKTGAGKSTRAQISDLIAAYSVTLPFVFLTATYFIIQKEFEIPKANTYIWDYTDVIATRNLGSEDPIIRQQGIEELYTRFGKEVVDPVLNKKLAFGQHLKSIAYDYSGYPDLFYLSADFTPKAIERFKEKEVFTTKDGFLMTKIFLTNASKRLAGEADDETEGETLGDSNTATLPNTNQDGGKLLTIEDVKADDGKIRKDAYKQFKNLELVRDLVTLVTPASSGFTNSLPGGEPYLNATNTESLNATNTESFATNTESDPSFLSRIDSLSLMYGSRFDIQNNPTLIMFLPTGVSGTNIFYTLTCFASLLMAHPWWNEHYEVACVVEDIKLPRGSSRNTNIARTGLDTVHIIGKDAKTALLTLETTLQCEKNKGLIILAGERLSMGISIPCADVVFMFSQKTAPDDLIQKMYRAVTPSPGKKMSFIVDLNPMRLLISLFGYTKASSKEGTTSTQVLKVLYDTYYWDVDQIQRGRNLETLAEEQPTFQGSLRRLAALASNESATAQNQSNYMGKIREIEAEFARRTKRPVNRSNVYSTEGLFGNTNRNQLENVNISEFMNSGPVEPPPRTASVIGINVNDRNNLSNVNLINVMNRRPVEPPPRTASVIGINVNDRNNLSNVNLLNVMNRRPVEPPPRTESVIGLAETERNNNVGNVNLSEFGYVPPVVRRPRTRTARTGRTTQTRNQFNQAPNFANFPRLPPPEGRIPVAHYRAQGNSNTENEYGSPLASPRARPALTIRGTNTNTMARNTQVPPAPPSTPSARRNRKTRRSRK